MKIAVTAVASALLLYAQSPLEKIDRLIDQIKQPRTGLSANAIAKSYDPFVYSSTKKKITVRRPAPKPKQRFVLSAIFNNRAKINGKWYKRGDTLYGYTIVDVSATGATLKRGGKTLRIAMQNRAKSKIKLIQMKD